MMDKKILKTLLKEFKKDRRKLVILMKNSTKFFGVLDDYDEENLYLVNDRNSSDKYIINLKEISAFGHSKEERK
jgi:small nuclear ribonucleoprotein (snRNP)-like protein